MKIEVDKIYKINWYAGDQSSDIDIVRVLDISDKLVRYEYISSTWDKESRSGSLEPDFFKRLTSPLPAYDTPLWKALYGS